MTNPQPNTAFSRTLWVVVMFVVLGALAGGFYLSGGPSVQREIRLDETRSSRISSLHYTIEGFVKSKNRLPKNLAEIASHQQLDPNADRFLDPETGQHFEYGLLSSTQYKLCVLYKTSNREEHGRNNRHYGSNGSGIEHPAGHYCYEYTVNK